MANKFNYTVSSSRFTYYIFTRRILPGNSFLWRVGSEKNREAAFMGVLPNFQIVLYSFYQNCTLKVLILLNIRM